MDDQIASFRNAYRYLSNFYLVQVGYEGLTYPSVEHAYQASKCKSKEDRILFLDGSSSQVNRLGRMVCIREDWEVVKLSVMEWLLRQKFFVDSPLAKRLLSTGDAELVEGNWRHDRFWGQCPIGVGKNHLGKLLMMIRDELQRG